MSESNFKHEITSDKELIGNSKEDGLNNDLQQLFCTSRISVETIILWFCEREETEKGKY